MTELGGNESYFTINNNYDSCSDNDETTKISKFPFRCQDCYSITKIKDFDFKINKYHIVCKNGHLLKYDSYEDLIEKSIIDLNNALCNTCLNSSSKKNLFKCNDCNIFFCDDCKTTHKEKTCHSHFIDLNEIINDNIKINKKDSSNNNDEEYEQIQDFNKKRININQALNEWKNYINQKIDNYLNAINNYYKTHENFFNYYKNNTEAFEKDDILDSNHKLLKDNIMKVNYYLEDIISYFKKKDFENDSISFIKILKDFDNIKVFSLNEKIEINLNKKIAEMDKMKLTLNSEANCFCPFNKGKYMLFGAKTGDILMYQQKNKSHFKYILTMKVFEEQVQHICELDEDLIAASDGKTSIKIIQFKDNLSEYIIVQTLRLRRDSGYVYSMIPLPILSTKKENHYFCTGDDNHILIFKSNTKPKYLSNEENDNRDISFELIKDINVNTLIHCLIEANENYIFAACSDVNKLKIFDVTKNFEELENIRGFELTKGSNIFTLIPKKNILIVGCTDGFILINTRKRKLHKRIFCKYKVLSLDMLSENALVCCTSDKKENRIKQYALDETFQFSKMSERRIHNNYDIWKLQKINQTIFFLDNESKINYLI